jgi:hypothetical protein
MELLNCMEKVKRSAVKSKHWSRFLRQAPIIPVQHRQCETFRAAVFSQTVCTHTSLFLAGRRPGFQKIEEVGIYPGGSRQGYPGWIR